MMIASVMRFIKNVLKGCLPGLLTIFLCHAEAHAIAMVQQVDLDAAADTLQIRLDQRTVFKTMQLGDREIMVAFKLADMVSSASGSRSGNGLVERYTLEDLPDQAVSLMIKTTQDVSEIKAEWLKDMAVLKLQLLSGDDSAAPEIPVKHRRFQKDIQATSGGDATETEAPEPAPVPGPEVPSVSETQDASNPFQTVSIPPIATGDLKLAPLPGQASTASEDLPLAGLLGEVSQGPCAASSILGEVLSLCENGAWEKAFSRLDAHDGTGITEDCRVESDYLKAFSLFKMNTNGAERLYLDAVSCFQDALSYYPDTIHAPFAMLALATIYNELGSHVEARGYYKLILKTYGAHSVSDTALLKLGHLYAAEGQPDLAVDTYRRYLETYPQSPFQAEVHLALGKSLYELNEVAESMEMFSRAIKENPHSVYEDPDALVFIGKLKYQLDDLEGAREAFIKAVNLHPDRNDAPDLLTRIGDTLKDSGQEAEAKKIYKLVMATYPDSDGFAISTIRYADLISTRVEKEEKYRTVINGFPGHPVATLATIRLAELQQQAGAYDAGIKTLRPLMSEDLSALKNEAEYVMALCFQGYFQQLSKREDPLAVIAAYEKEKSLVDRFGDPEILETVGAAFFQAKFFSQAEDLFQASYAASTPASRPASLYRRFAETLQELGKNMQAREMFHAYFEKLPEKERRSDAYLNMARLLTADESWESALSFIKSGLRRSEDEMEKSQFLVLQAEVSAGMGNVSAVPDLMIQAINRLASSKETTNEQLMNAYRQLGENYMTLSSFGDAGDAFNMALNFSEGSRPPDLLYLLAQSSLKLQDLAAARMALSEIVGAGDEFWARMAEEQIRAIALTEKLDRQEKNQ